MEPSALDEVLNAVCRKLSAYQRCQQIGGICRWLQDPLYKANYYLSVMEFRQQTLERLQKFVDRRYFVTKDYIDSEPAAALSLALLCVL